MRFAVAHLQAGHGRRRWVMLGTILCFLAPVLWAKAQDSATEPDPSTVAPAQVPVDPAAEAAHTPPAAAATKATPSVWDLTLQGGIFMLPIAVCSVVVVAYAIERFIGLRTQKIAPVELVSALYALNNENNGIDPRQAYEICRQHPSPLSRIIQAGVLKVGRPQTELEKAVEDAAAAEADDMSANLKPINTASVLGPQLGLIGTVQGMIMAFIVTSTTTATGAAKGQELATGIYTALVTTFAGLCVSIPAITLATMIESRIDRLLKGMETVFSEILPQFERFEGKYRIARNNDATSVVLKSTAPKPAARPASSTEGPSTASAPKSLWGVMGTGKAE